MNLPNLENFKADVVFDVSNEIKSLSNKIDKNNARNSKQQNMILLISAISLFVAIIGLFAK